MDSSAHQRDRRSRRPRHTPMRTGCTSRWNTTNKIKIYWKTIYQEQCFLFDYAAKSRPGALSYT